MTSPTDPDSSATPTPESDPAAAPSLAREVFQALPTPVRWASYTAVGVVLLLLVSSAVAASFYRRPLPQTDGEVRLPGLSDRVQVLRDEYGVAQIIADTDQDLMRAQGYVSAQERFFQMDLQRHRASGRLAELFGPQALVSDKFVRTLGWRRVAEREVGLLAPESRRLLEAYADGVNAWLSDRPTTDLAAEYSVLALTGLDYTPEPWGIADSLVWLKAAAWDQRSNMGEEIERVDALIDHSPLEVARLYPDYDFEARPAIVSGGAVVGGLFDQQATAESAQSPARSALERAQVALRLDGAGTLPQLPGIGSNAWVVAGSRSATGAPLLAADPHRATGQPGTWFPVGLHCRKMTAQCSFDVSGFAYAGVPGVIFGHNADIAWGAASLEADTSDLFLEKLSSSGWWWREGWRELTVRHETIKVRGAADFHLQIRSTDHGPLISDVSSTLSTVGANAQLSPQDEAESGAEPGETGVGSGAYAVALRWTGLDPAPSADAIFALNRARGWASFREAARAVAVPAQSLVYADRSGHIGYQATGRIPVRRPGNDGTLPSAGWRAADDWRKKPVPFEALPSVLDPDSGVIVAANNAVIGPDYPYYLGRDVDLGYRAKQITDLLASHDELTVETMQEIQGDVTDPLAPILVPYLLDVELPPGYYSAGQRLLSGWDQRLDPDSAAAAYFQEVWSQLLELGFADDLRDSGAPDGGSRWVAVVSDLLADPTSPWWDDVTTEDQVETRDDILVAAQLAARDDLTRRLARNPAGWRWGNLHRLRLDHVGLSDTDLPLVGRLFNRDADPVGGGPTTVAAYAWDAAQGYDVTSAPTARMVVSLGDFDRSRWVALTGVSGHPASDHYSDQTDLFVQGEAMPWAFSRGAVDAAAEHTLELVPAGEDVTGG